MAGITSEGYRKYLNTFGVDICVSEMVSDMGLIYQNKETESYVKYQKDGTLTGVQLFGAKPENLAKAATRALELNPEIDFFDVNGELIDTKLFQLLDIASIPHPTDLNDHS